MILEFRAHRLVSIQQTVRELTPDELLGGNALTELESCLLAHVETELNALRYPEFLDPDNGVIQGLLWYVEDTFGTENGLRRMVSQNAVVTRDLWQARPETPVRLTCSPDILCRLCAKGKHCTQGATTHYDQGIITRVLNQAEKHGLAKRLSASFSQKTVDTSAGTLRDLLTVMTIAGDSF